MIHFERSQLHVWYYTEITLTANSEIQTREHKRVACKKYKLANIYIFLNIIKVNKRVIFF